MCVGCVRPPGRALAHGSDTLTHVQDVQVDDVGRGAPELIGRLHPDLVGREEGEVTRDVARVRLPRAVVVTLLVLAVPPAGEEENTRVEDQCTKIMFGLPDYIVFFN